MLVITINLSEIKDAQKKRKANPARVVVVDVSQEHTDLDQEERQDLETTFPEAHTNMVDDESAHHPPGTLYAHSTEKDKLLKDLEQEFRDAKRSRARLSNAYPQLVRNGCSPETLRSHNKEIEAITNQLKHLYDTKQFVEIHGHLPQEEKTPETVADLKMRRRSIVDARSKTRKKLEVAKAKGIQQSKIVEWEMKIERLDAEYNEVVDLITNME